jgi:hypothetical protein
MKRKVFLIIILLVTVIAVWYAYAEYNRTNDDLSHTRVTTTVSAAALLSVFEKDSANAVKLYSDKIIAVTGTIKKIEAEGNPAIIFLGDAAQMSSVQCSMDSTNASAYTPLKTGDAVTLKGLVSGYRTDPLFGTDVILNRCVIAAKP